MQVPIDQTLKVLKVEFGKHAVKIVFMFLVVSLLVLLVGYNWPKTYKSSTSIFADKKNIIRPLMEGVAEGTRLISKEDARELMFSRKILREILEAGGWSAESLTPIELQRIAENIKENTEILQVSPNIIRITYADTDAKRAFSVASKFSEMFLAETVASKKRESHGAYDFIDSQVSEYQAKLTLAEEKLKEFRTANVDIRAGNGEYLTGIAGMRRRLSQSRLDLKEAQIRQESLQSQLSNESQQTQSITTVNVYQRKIQELRDQLAILSLRYHDTYPDVISLRQQISDMERTLKSEASQFKQQSGYAITGSNASGVGGSVNLYQDLRRQLSATKTEIRTHHTRISEIQKQIAAELNRANELSESQVVEAKLVRDYEVNKDIYQNLLRKREKARVSMHMDIEGKGVTYKVHEPANLPLIPHGIRFSHFLILGPLLGFGIPAGFLFLLLQVDPRIRTEHALTEGLGLPLLSSLTPIWKPNRRRSSKKTSLITLMILLVVSIYVVVGWAKYTDSELSSLLPAGTAQSSIPAE